MEQAIKTGVMICGHGSRDEKAVEEFNLFAESLTNRLSAYEVESGFLQYSKPEIRIGLEALKDRGVTRIICLPCMLFAAGHVKNDLPLEVAAFQKDNPAVEIALASELGVDAKLLALAAERIEEAENSSANKVERAKTLLLVVGRGSSDSDANSNVPKIARMLWEGMGFGWAETAYSGVVAPSVGEGMAQAAKLGYQRIIAFPYFLFTGVQVKGVRDGIAEAAALYPEIEVLTTGCLGGHPQVVECFAERLTQALSGDNVMNCLDCDAREQIIS